MSFLRWRKRKKRATFSCVGAIIAATSGATDAMLRFDLIEARRKKLKISKGQLAELVGVDQSTLWRYRRRGMKPGLDIAERLAEVLQVSVDELRAKAPAQRVGGQR
jgi:predicted transcriptional regulator